MDVESYITYLASVVAADNILKEKGVMQESKRKYPDFKLCKG